MHDAGLGTCRAVVQAYEVDDVERRVVDSEAVQCCGGDTSEGYPPTLTSHCSSRVEQVLCRWICCRVNVGGHIEATAHAYEGSVPNCNRETAISLAAVQCLASAEDATARLDDLAEILGHGATMRDGLTLAELRCARCVDNC